MKRHAFKKYLAGFVSFITFVVYLSSLRNGFVDWDDPAYVFENPYIHSIDPGFVKWAFLTFRESNWHPLTWISHALDYAIWGLNPLGHHLANNILHGVNTFIVALLVMRLIEVVRKSSELVIAPKMDSFHDNSRFVLIAAGVTGLLFGLHPLHVESVAWVAERKDLLCAFFFLLSLMSYISFALHRAYKTYIFSLAFFILALLSKPMAVSLPAVLLILDWYPFKRLKSIKLFLSALAEKLPFVLFSFISAILTILAQREGGSIRSFEAISLSSRVLVAAKSLLGYLCKMMLPINLIPYYPYPRNVSLLSPEYILSIVLVLGITAACVLMAKRNQRLFLSVWGYYILTLIPVLGIIQVGGQSMADRYSYLPSLGPFLILGLLSARGYEMINTLQVKARLAKYFGVTVAIIVLVLLFFSTLKQITIWKDDLTLWSYVTDREPGQVAFAHYNLGTVYLHRNMYDKAAEQYLITLKMKPYFMDAHYNLGLTYCNQGRAQECMYELNFAYAIDHYKRGMAYSETGSFEKAVQELQTAVMLKSDFAEAHFYLGFIYYKMGQMPNAQRELTTGLNIEPDNQGARQLLHAIP
jgi:hypothetical protein